MHTKKKKKRLQTRKNDVKLNFMREARPITRSGYKAAFCIRFDRKSNKWVVGEFEREHNHNLVTQFKNQFLCSHWAIKDFNKA